LGFVELGVAGLSRIRVGWIRVRHEASKELMIEVEVFCVMTPCNVVVGYQRFRGPCCFCL